MNISQHCFVPRGNVLTGFYSLSGIYNPNNPSASTTEKQIGDVYNCFQLFGSFVPTGGTWYALRLFDSVTTAQSNSNYVGVTSDGYVPPILVKKSDVYTASAFTSINVPNGLKVSAIMWFE